MQSRRFLFFYAETFCHFESILGSQLGLGIASLSTDQRGSSSILDLSFGLFSHRKLLNGMFGINSVSYILVSGVDHRSGDAHNFCSAPIHVIQINYVTTLSVSSYSEWSLKCRTQKYATILIASSNHITMTRNG